mmetsp:Transcript_26257/g.36580  ORF Transcript_26257/g.36580 Transcript_26257/m.36580 type:complete len:223 (+) Transcript_26257:112-780(+)|eukprot:CAMPEP_0184498868 /NCGR_PEP_ID=MMETSP0113_2-20130426/40071_1 /TAXON_ID=91329 /ORGANISM="Norrisiella sphaerica, Strain BC52" /LENGTH=222 /DNA_ID=CAMNT_0026886569 /DNA_START=97 /DNA_END=765 /DNA_ORIENTATION=-
MYQPVPDGDRDRSTADTKDDMNNEPLKDPMELFILQAGRGRRKVTVSRSWTVQEFKERIFPEEVAANKNIRTIFQGKLLQDQATLEESGLQDNAFVHISICDFSPGLVNNPEDDNHNANNHGPYGDIEDAQIPQWLLQAHFTRQGSNGDFILGFIMGFFLGVLTLIWVWQRAVPRRQKLGIMLGFMCNLLLSFIQVANNNPDGHASQPTPDTPGTADPGVGH